MPLFVAVTHRRAPLRPRPPHPRWPARPLPMPHLPRPLYRAGAARPRRHLRTQPWPVGVIARLLHHPKVRP